MKNRGRFRKYVPSILLLVVFRKYLSADALSNGLKM